MHSRTISSIFTAAAYKGALLGCCCARTKHLSATPTIDATANDAWSATVGRPYAALLGASPASSVPAPARPLDIATASHTSSTLGSPSSCNPPLGEVGLVVEGSSIVGMIGFATVGCSMMGAIGSTLAYACSAWGATGSSMCLLSLAADGCRTSIDSSLQQKNIKKHTTMPKEYDK